MTCIGELLVIGKSKVRKFSNPLVKFLVVFLTFLASDRGIAAKMLAFGDIRGHMEPCGCDPRTDVGGVRRIGAAIARYRAVDAGVTVIFTGNLVHYSTMKEPTELMLPTAISAIKPDVSLVNEFEWKHLRSGQSLPDIRWVISNAGPRSNNQKPRSVIVSGNTEYYGVLELKNQGLDPVDSKLAKKLKGLTKTNLPENRVLIYAGSIKSLHNIAMDGFFGTVILANQTPLGHEPGDAERRQESSLIKALGKKSAYMVPFGGAGILRLGGLELTDIPKFLMTDKSFAKPTGIGFPTAIFFHWLDSAEEVAVPDELLKLSASARAQDAENFRKLAEVRVKDLPATPFAGSKSCESCHKSAYEVWLKSKHAVALATLAAKSRQQDPPCVECHVLGFAAKGGYVSEDKSPQFSNVQCESCHGPRLEHVNNPTIKVQVSAADSCAGCHTPPHSPGFDPKSYWEKIKHK